MISGLFYLLLIRKIVHLPVIFLNNLLNNTHSQMKGHTLIFNG